MRYSGDAPAAGLPSSGAGGALQYAPWVRVTACAVRRSAVGRTSDVDARSSGRHSGTSEYIYTEMGRPCRWQQYRSSHAERL